MISEFRMLPSVILHIVVLNIISLHATLTDRSSLDESNLTSVLTVQIVQECLLLEDRTVAVIGPVPEMVSEMLHSSEIAAIGSIGHSRSKAYGMYGQTWHSKTWSRQSIRIRLQRSVQAFVVAAPTQTLLRHALETAKISVWWNSAAFFIATSTSENDTCENAFAYLWTLWQMGILSSVFLCKENDGSLAIYGYSPYYDGHNDSWRKVEVHGGRGGHSWSLLKPKQVHGANICEMIVFDKVKQLNGHPISVGLLTIPPTLTINMKMKDGDWFDKHVGEDAMIVHIIWKALNGSIQPIYYQGKNPIGYAEGNETYSGFFGDVSMGRVDHGGNGLMVDHWGIQFAYPHAISGVHLLTPSKGNIPSWLKIATMYEIPVTIGILATLLIAIIFLRFVAHRPWSTATQEVIRVALSVSMLHLPTRLSTRLFWSTVFIMILVMNSVFQGSLISIITKPTPYRNIDTIDDMLSSDYTIHGYSVFKTFFDDSKLSERFQSVTNPRSHIKDIVWEDTVAYASDYLYLKAVITSTEQFHISQQAVGSFHTAYFTKPDWPLFSRFDTTVQRLVNAGITEYWREFYLNQIARGNWAQMRNASLPNLKVLTVTDLAFVFYGLVIGLLCSTTAFVIEFTWGCFVNYIQK